ncbi:hypothetical protein GCM10009625_35190 [Brachybacterium fresconis]
MGKRRYSVAGLNPARRAIAPSGTSMPRIVNSSRAAVIRRSRFSRASERSRVEPVPALLEGPAPLLPEPLTSVGRLPDRLLSVGLLSVGLLSVGRLPDRLLSVGRLPDRLLSVGRLPDRLLSVGRLPGRLLSVGRLPGRLLGVFPSAPAPSAICE